MSRPWPVALTRLPRWMRLAGGAYLLATASLANTSDLAVQWLALVLVLLAGVLVVSTLGTSQAPASASKRRKRSSPSAPAP